MQLSVAVKGIFSLSENASAKPAAKTQEAEGDTLFESEGKQALKYPSDFTPFKPRADILLVGTAHASGGRPVPDLKVSLRVGQLQKALYVVGDRSWRGRFLRWSSASSPAEFTVMPVTYQRAYGGRKFKKNPVGLGFHQKRLPNIESATRVIRRRWNRPPPAGFGPIAADWEPRRSKVGTYRGKWRKERWPWFPDNFDWSYFNAAPEDQQVEGYLRGDEELEFQNLHPKYAIYRSRLPGLRARAFVQVELPSTEPEFREVRLNLDTLWIDTEAEKVVLVWRGLTPVRSVKFKEVTHIFAFTESLSSPPCSKDEAQALMQQRIREGAGAVRTPEEEAEDAASRAGWEKFEKDMAAMGRERAELEQEFEALEQDVARQVEQQKAELIAGGVDPKVLEQPAQSQTIAEMKAQLAAEIARLAETDPTAAAKLADVEKELDEIENMEQEFAALEAEESPPLTRESVQAAVAQSKSLAGVDVSDLDLSNLDLSGADFSGADFSKANLTGTKLIGTRLGRTDFSKANLAGVDLSHAILDDADFSEAKLEGAKFPGASIGGATFSELQLSGADFSGCRGEHPRFSASNLEKANFVGAWLPQADFTKANVKGANFLQAELPSADFGGASAMGINMERADVTNLRAAGKANFTDGKFRGAKAPKSVWDGALLDRADFSCAVLSRALFEGASVKETSFDRADLTKANFEDASAQRALLTNANLLRASFNRTDLTEASLAGSNAYEASFWETVFHHTNIRGANIKRTLIA